MLNVLDGSDEEDRGRRMEKSDLEMIEEEFRAQAQDFHIDVAAREDRRSIGLIGPVDADCLISNLPPCRERETLPYLD